MPVGEILSVFNVNDGPSIYSMSRPSKKKKIVYLHAFVAHVVGAQREESDREHDHRTRVTLPKACKFILSGFDVATHNTYIENTTDGRPHVGIRVVIMCYTFTRVPTAPDFASGYPCPGHLEIGRRMKNLSTYDEFPSRI